MAKTQKTALEAAVALLAVRAYSTADLRKKLFARKIYSSAEIQAALDDCLRMRFLDDDLFTEGAVSSMKFQGYGNRRIVMKLREKGIPHEQSTRKIQEMEQENPDDGLDQPAIAKEVLRRRRMTILGVEDPIKRREKALRLLASRGFPPGVVYDAVRSFLAEAGKSGETPDDDEGEVFS